MEKLIKAIGDHVDTELGLDQSRYGQLPDEPNNVIIYNYRSGISPIYSIGRGTSYRRRPFLEVRVRNEDYFDGLGIIDDVRIELERLYGQVGDHYIVSIVSTSDILENGRDTNNRYNFMMNYILEISKEEE